MAMPVMGVAWWFEVANKKTHSVILRFADLEAKLHTGTFPIFVVVKDDPIDKFRPEIGLGKLNYRLAPLGFQGILRDSNVSFKRRRRLHPGCCAAVVLVRVAVVHRVCLKSG